MLDPAATGQRDYTSRSRPLLRTSIGDVLRRTRLHQGRTLAEVARRARVSLPYLSELERGRKEASSEVLAAICEALHIDLPDLLAAVGRDLRRGRDRRAPVIRIGFAAAENGQAPLAEPGALLAEPDAPLAEPDAPLAERGAHPEDIAEPAPAAGDEPVPSPEAQLATVISLSDAPHILLTRPATAPPNPGELRCRLRAA